MRTSTLKSIAALALTGAGSALVLGFRTVDAPTDGASSDVAASGTGATSGTGTASGGSGSGATGGTGSTSGGGTSTGSGSGSGSGGGTTSTATYADGTWTGSAIQEPWGGFQVAVTVASGEIVKVTVVESPSDRRSARINSQAVPILTQSVVASQGESIDMVTGATWTSDSYATSLQSALDAAAKAA
jgi:uncharacterized protein with FMN-binding domain